MIRFLAKYYPYFLSILIIWIFYKFNNKFINLLNFGSLISSSMVVFSVLLGFLLTITTLLHTIDNTAMRTLKKTKQYGDLLHYLNYSIYFSLLISTTSLSIPILKSILLNLNVDIIFWSKYLMLFLILTTLILTIRFITVFISLMTSKLN